MTIERDIERNAVADSLLFSFFKPVGFKGALNRTLSCPYIHSTEETLRVTEIFTWHYPLCIISRTKRQVSICRDVFELKLNWAEDNPQNMVMQMEGHKNRCVNSTPKYKKFRTSFMTIYRTLKLFGEHLYDFWPMVNRSTQLGNGRQNRIWFTPVHKLNYCIRREEKCSFWNRQFFYITFQWNLLPHNTNLCFQHMKKSLKLTYGRKGLFSFVEQITILSQSHKMRDNFLWTILGALQIKSTAVNALYNEIFL